MYQSGGQLTIFGWLVALTVGGAVGVGFVAQLFKSQNITEVVLGLGSLAFWGGIAYLIYRRSSGRRR